MGFVRKLCAGLGALALIGVAASASAETKLKLGTAAAPDSPWGQAFKAWKKAVEAKTNGAVSFDFFFNSTQGSEATMVDKIKAGQLDGAALTSFGLSKIDKRLLTMQVPGVIRSWKTADAVREKLAPDFDTFFAAKKITLVTYGDVGYAHFFSKGFEVKTPSDLLGKSPWVWADEPILKTVYGKVNEKYAAGGSPVNPFPAELMQVLPSLDNGKINCMSTAALSSEMLQWNSKFDHGVDAVNGIIVGAIILSTDSLDKLPADAKAAVLDMGKKMGTSASGLRDKIRKEDAAAWERFKSRSNVKIYTPTTEDMAKWNDLFKSARDALKAGTFDAALVTKIETLAAANP